MDYSLLVGIHNCDAADPQQQKQLDLGDARPGVTNSSDERDSSGSAGTPPDSPLMQRNSRIVSFTAELDSRLEFFAIKCAERECCAADAAAE